MLSILKKVRKINDSHHLLSKGGAGLVDGADASCRISGPLSSVLPKEVSVSLLALHF